MAQIEDVTVSLPQQMIADIRRAVEAGEYASSDEVIREALRDWSRMRSLREQGIAQLRRVWQQAAGDESPGLDPNEVLGRLERKYRARAGEAEAQEECA